MGYYGAFEYHFDETVRIDEKKTKEVENYFANYDNPYIGGFAGVGLEVRENKLVSINLDDYDAKFYDEKLFAEKLSKAITSGSVSLRFFGEDGGFWGYKVSSGAIEDLVSLIVTQEDAVIAGKLLDKYHKGELRAV